MFWRGSALLILIPFSKSEDFRLLILPFTAHVKLPEDYRWRYSFQVHVDEVESSIRLWAVKLALNFLKDTDKRSKDLYFRLYMRLLSAIGDEGLAELYTNFPRCKKLIYLDAVISGRASHIILLGFRNAGYTPYAILMVDATGQSSNPSIPGFLGSSSIEDCGAFTCFKSYLLRFQGFFFLRGSLNLCPPQSPASVSTYMLNDDSCIYLSHFPNYIKLILLLYGDGGGLCCIRR